MQKIIVSVINDLTIDQRVDKICSSLQNMGFEVFLVGRKFKQSIEIERPYKFHRMKVFSEKGMFSYIEFSIRLFFFLLFTKKSILLANDLDTLLPNYLISKIQGKKLVYDSHELFLELPELIHRPKKRFIWLKIEKFILPKLKNTYTVCQSIADYYDIKYNTNFKVVRNIPVYVNEETRNKSKETREKRKETRNKRKETREKRKEKREKKQEFNHKSQPTTPNLKPKTPNPKLQTPNPKTIIYQGAINVGRGLELMIETMQYLDNYQFIIIGDGEITQKIKTLIKSENLTEKVLMLGKKTPSELKKITPKADLGLSIEEDLGLNYRYALPNKLFDYIHANVPVLVSDLPEMKRIVLDYQIGEIVKDRNPKELAKQIKFLLEKDKTIILKNLKKAALELQWQNEEKILYSVYNNLK